MDGQFSVELADLRGWADQVVRAGEHCDRLARYLATYVPDGDFGPILSPIRPDYERIVLRLLETLGLDATGLHDTGAALRHVGRRYHRADVRVAEGFDRGVAVDDRLSTAAFHDRGPLDPACPIVSGESLPEVSFGGLVDLVFDFLHHHGCIDIRQTVTDWITGDIGKASAQASAWEQAGAGLLAVADNLTTGAARVARTWEGRAATSASAHALSWVGALEQQARAMQQVAAHLRDAIIQAVDVAQVVVDIVVEIVCVVKAALTFASIPGYGQLRAVETITDVIGLVWKARSVLAVFWRFLVLLKDDLVLVTDCFGAESLPPSPSLPASVA
jgi:uncharacterized protein YukE